MNIPNAMLVTRPIAEPRFCNKCIPLTEAHKDSIPPHDYHAYPHQPDGWVKGTQLFCCENTDTLRKPCGRFFLEYNDLQDHLEWYNEKGPEKRQVVTHFGYRWSHEALQGPRSIGTGASSGVGQSMLTDQSELFLNCSSRNVGELLVLCPHRGCSVTYQTGLKPWYNFWEVLKDHLLEHRKRFSYKWERTIESIQTIQRPLTCTRWTCPRPDCKRLFHREADFKRHLPVHDQSQRDFPCPADGCERGGSNGFPRKDKLRDHMRAKHRSLAEELMEPAKRRRVGPKAKKT